MSGEIVAAEAAIEESAETARWKVREGVGTDRGATFHAGAHLGCVVMSLDACPPVRRLYGGHHDGEGYGHRYGRGHRHGYHYSHHYGYDRIPEPAPAWMEPAVQ